MVQTIEADIIIVGAGLVGASFALALKDAPLTVALLETHLPDLDPATEADSRPLSLTLGSQQLLKTLGVWPELAASAAMIQRVHVSEQGRWGELCFSALEANTPALGYVVPHARLQRVLYQHAMGQKNIRFMNIQQLAAIERQHNCITATVKTVQGLLQLTASLLIAADGSHSHCRQLLGIAAHAADFAEVAFTTTLQLAAPHQGTAYERFTAAGTLALLPQSAEKQYRLVWVTDKQQASILTACPAAELIEKITTAFGGRLQITAMEPLSSGYPLITLQAEKQILPQVALLGNAAHTLYPLAAQGFNLGLKDAAVLAEAIKQALARQQCLSDFKLLQAYLAKREPDQRIIRCLTTGISQGFNLHLPGLGVARGLGLLATELCVPLKRRLTRQLIGVQ